VSLTPSVVPCANAGSGNVTLRVSAELVCAANATTATALMTAFASASQPLAAALVASVAAGANVSAAAVTLSPATRSALTPPQRNRTVAVTVPITVAIDLSPTSTASAAAAAAALQAALDGAGGGADALLSGWFASAAFVDAGLVPEDVTLGARQYVCATPPQPSDAAIEVGSMSQAAVYGGLSAIVGVAAIIAAVAFMYAMSRRRGARRKATAEKRRKASATLAAVAEDAAAGGTDSDDDGDSGSGVATNIDAVEDLFGSHRSLPTVRTVGSLLALDSVRSLALSPRGADSSLPSARGSARGGPLSPRRADSGTTNLPSARSSTRGQPLSPRFSEASLASAASGGRGGPLPLSPRNSGSDGDMMEDDTVARMYESGEEELAPPPPASPRRPRVPIPTPRLLYVPPPAPRAASARSMFTGAPGSVPSSVAPVPPVDDAAGGMPLSSPVAAARTSSAAPSPAASPMATPQHGGTPSAAARKGSGVAVPSPAAPAAATAVPPVVATVEAAASTMASPRTVPRLRLASSGDASPAGPAAPLPPQPARAAKSARFDRLRLAPGGSAADGGSGSGSSSARSGGGGGGGGGGEEAWSPEDLRRMRQLGLLRGVGTSGAAAASSRDLVAAATAAAASSRDLVASSTTGGGTARSGGSVGSATARSLRDDDLAGYVDEVTARKGPVFQLPDGPWLGEGSRGRFVVTRGGEEGGDRVVEMVDDFEEGEAEDGAELGPAWAARPPPQPLTTRRSDGTSPVTTTAPGDTARRVSHDSMASALSSPPAITAPPSPRRSMAALSARTGSSNGSVGSAASGGPAAGAAAGGGASGGLGRTRSSAAAMQAGLMAMGSMRNVLAGAGGGGGSSPVPTSVSPVPGGGDASPVLAGIAGGGGGGGTSSRASRISRVPPLDGAWATESPNKPLSAPGTGRPPAGPGAPRGTALAAITGVAPTPRVGSSGADSMSSAGEFDFGRDTAASFYDDESPPVAWNSAMRRTPSAMMGPGGAPTPRTGVAPFGAGLAHVGVGRAAVTASPLGPGTGTGGSSARGYSPDRSVTPVRGSGVGTPGFGTPSGPGGLASPRTLGRTPTAAAGAAVMASPRGGVLRLQSFRFDEAATGAGSTADDYDF